MNAKTSLDCLPSHADASLCLALAQSPAAENAPAVLFLGGFHSTMRGMKAEYLAALCASQGWAFTRFDYRGHGESDGLAEVLGPADWLDDTLTVIDYLDGPQFLVGSSMGAWLALAATRLRPEKVQGLMTLAAAPEFPRRLLWPRLSVAERERLAAGETLELPSDYSDTPWRVRRRLFDDDQALRVLGADDTLHIHCPVRLVHGLADTDIPPALSTQLCACLAAPDVSLLLLKYGDHRLSDESALEQIGASLLALVMSVQQ